jgi:NitT/TauT family transport system substrate-binding protein
MKKFLLAIVFVLFIVGLVGCRKSKYIEIKVAEVAHSVFYAPQYAALTKGFFEEEGLKVTLVNANGADKVMAALLSKDCQIGLMGPEASVYVYNQGQADYAINFAQLTQRDGSFIVGREDIPNFTISMLQGKSILGGRKGGVPEMTLEYVIKNAGLTLKQNETGADVNVRTDVQFAAMAGAFASGEGDYTTLFEPTATQFERDGKGYVLCSVGQLSGAISYTAYSTTKSYFEKNPEIIKKFIRALYKGQQFVLNGNDQEVMQAMKPHFAEISDQDLLAVVTSYRSIQAWAPSPVFSEEAFNRLQDVMTLAGELTTRVPFATIVNTEFATGIVNGN